MHEMEENLSVIHSSICAIAILLAIYLGAALLILRDTIWESIRGLLRPASQATPDEATKTVAGSGVSIQGTRASH
ncbi:hypothetical protein [Noviherbaspirillum sp. Root189]|uniref:hypothetical protein n=1 Tax=Noviherbaspirillum sp. Root189 TaxID=1736487 RepID=UPI000714F92D|nr:hypothetical protein [Noviherbaspirillum sp. Root189]KRB87579.1 hypothetical protein ASE07_19535 [Noviherbaspirillum sp. Root189]